MFDYAKLWKLVKHKGLKKTDLKKEIGITPSTLAKLNRNENVSMEVLNRLCEYLECDIGDIVEHVYTPYKTDDSLGTFTPNKDENIHNWFSYLEGYSKSLVETELKKLKGVSSVLDPFSGSGTTPLVGVLNGLTCYYCETNPVMAFISNMKTTVSFKIAKDSKKMKLFKSYKEKLIYFFDKLKFDENKTVDFQGFEKYFDQENLFYIQKYKEFLELIEDDSVKDMFRVALAGVAVNVSKMIRRGDLRYAKGKELNKTNQKFTKEIVKKLNRIYSDISELKTDNIGEAIYLCEDARDISNDNIVDLVITSPPYLNGTNYIRNTKLELKLLDFVLAEKDLPKMHKKGIVAGINNVSSKDKFNEPIESVKRLIDSLNEVSYDSRIQKMIIAYFNDMNDVFFALRKSMKNQGILIMDIGDSQFAGVHVPTHEILIEIAKNQGFEIYENEIIRSRKSKNGFDLTQRILRFKLNKNENSIEEFKKKAKLFLEEKTYQEKGRNWGHPWHSICSYRGKLKPAIASELISKFSNVGDRVLDPMCGVGTIPLEACLQGRIGVANDLSELAYIVSTAKVSKPFFEDVNKSVCELEEFINLYKDSFENDNEVRSFGLNKTIIEYYHPETMKEILAAREFFRLRRLTPADCLTMSCLMHILHGNRPYALSRTSHPLTPYAPKGEFIYKNLIKHLKNKINRTYQSIDNKITWTKGESYNLDVLTLNDSLTEKCDVIITSPPFASSFRFYTQNWLRLWFSGWGKDDFKNAEKIFFDNKQNKDMDIYYEFFKECASMLKHNGKLILHVGKSERIDMSRELIERSKKWFEVIEAGEELFLGENHGVVDKGATTAHQYIFCVKK